jgi:DNA-binding NarL/FixJ family response regulator
MEHIKVGVFDDHEIFAHGVMAVVGEDPTIGRVTVDPGDAGDVDVAVTSFPRMVDLGLSCPVVVCVTERELAVMPSLEAASAVLLRESVTPEQLLGALHAAAAGLRIEAATSVPDVLDTRCREILRLLADGAGTREISEVLGYSERTIKGAIQQAQQLLGARSRAQAVAVALKSALI